MSGRSARAAVRGSSEQTAPASVAPSHGLAPDGGPGPGAGEWSVPQAHPRRGRRWHGSTPCDRGYPWTPSFHPNARGSTVPGEMGCGATDLITSDPGF